MLLVKKLSFDPHYQTALEIAGAVRIILCESKRLLQRIIDFLKKNRAGQTLSCHWQRLNRVLLWSSSNKHWSLVKVFFLGLASSLVTYDASLDTIFQNLLGTAIFWYGRQCTSCGPSGSLPSRIVTLDGTELRTNWFLRWVEQIKTTIRSLSKPELDVSFCLI